MQAIKIAILSKLDSSLQDSDIIKLQQMLDPETKTLILRRAAIELLQQAIITCIDKQLIVQTIASKTDVNSTYDDGNNEQSELKATNTVREINSGSNSYSVKIDNYLSSVDFTHKSANLGNSQIYSQPATNVKKLARRYIN